VQFATSWWATKLTDFCAGILTRRVADAALVFLALQVRFAVLARLISDAELQGRDPLDATSTEAGLFAQPELQHSRPLRIGMPREYAVAELGAAANEAS
jgi:Asp-tRNA(Asn)/Glu-tRNA(Gln) amidotransferase A subunit family amidase